MEEIDPEKEELKKALTDDFLALLYRASVVFGDLGDSVEVKSFVMWCYDLLDKPYPDQDTSLLLSKL
jgi:hypothetical protein